MNRYLKFREWIQLKEFGAAGAAGPAGMSNPDQEQLQDKLANAATGKNPQQAMKQVIDDEKKNIDSNAQTGEGKIKKIAQLGAATSELKKQGMLQAKMKKRMKKK